MARTRSPICSNGSCAALSWKSIHIVALSESSSTLAPASTLNSELGAYEPWALVQTDYSDLGDLDGGLEQARDLLIRAVRADAPVAGSLTLMRLRRARSREDLLGLLEEVGVDRDGNIYAADVGFNNLRKYVRTR